MKFVVWNDPDPRVRWGNPNLRWGSPSYLIERGDPGYVELQPGQPGYVPPAPSPKPKRKPLGRLTSDNPNTTTNTPTDMIDNSFHYDIGPAGGGRWRPRADIQGKQTPEQHIAAVIAKCQAVGLAVTAEQITAILTASHEETIDQARRTVSIDYPGGYQRMMPTAGTSHETPEFEGIYDNLAPDASISLTKKGRIRFATDFTSTLGTTHAEKGATITQVICVTNGADNQYKVGKLQRMTGTDLDAVLDTGCGIFYIASDGTMTQVAAEDISKPTRPSELNWIAPSTLTGPQQLKICVNLNGGVRTTYHTHLLTPAT